VPTAVALKGRNIISRSEYLYGFTTSLFYFKNTTKGHGGVSTAAKTSVSTEKTLCETDLGMSLTGYDVTLSFLIYLYA
jgi:DNA-directed RNA polymerase beta' subunit